jgi:hypothetical protein
MNKKPTLVARTTLIASVLIMGVVSMVAAAVGGGLPNADAKEIKKEKPADNENRCLLLPEVQYQCFPTAADCDAAQPDLVGSHCTSEKKAIKSVFPDGCNGD